MNVCNVMSHYCVLFGSTAEEIKENCKKSCCEKFYTFSPTPSPTTTPTESPTLEDQCMNVNPDDPLWASSCPSLVLSGACLVAPVVATNCPKSCCVHSARQTESPTPGPTPSPTDGCGDKTDIWGPGGCASMLSWCETQSPLGNATRANCERSCCTGATPEPTPAPTGQCDMFADTGAIPCEVVVLDPNGCAGGPGDFVYDSCRKSCCLEALFSQIPAPGPGSASLFQHVSKSKSVVEVFEGAGLDVKETLGLKIQVSGTLTQYHLELSSGPVTEAMRSLLAEICAYSNLDGCTLATLKARVLGTRRRMQDATANVEFEVSGFPSLNLLQRATIVIQQHPITLINFIEEEFLKAFPDERAKNIIKVTSVEAEMNEEPVKPPTSSPVVICHAERTTNTSVMASTRAATTPHVSLWKWGASWAVVIATLLTVMVLISIILVYLVPTTKTSNLDRERRRSGSNVRGGPRHEEAECREEFSF